MDRVTRANYLLLGGPLVLLIGLLFVGWGNQVDPARALHWLLASLGWIMFLGGLVAFGGGLVGRLSARQRPQVEIPASVSPVPRPSPAAASPQTSSAAAAAPYPVRPSPPAPSSPPLRRWPDSPFVALLTPEAKDLWEMVRRSKVPREKLLVLCREPPQDLQRLYELQGATFWQIARSEGEGKVRPSELDRIGDLIERHLSQGEGRYVVLGDVSLLIDDSGLRNVRRLLQVAHETAEAKGGRVVFRFDPGGRSSTEAHQLEEGALVLS